MESWPFSKQKFHWINNIEKGNLARFPSLEEVIGTDQSLLSDIAIAIQAHLQQLLNAFNGYFSAGNLEPLDKEPLSISTMCHA